MTVTKVRKGVFEKIRDREGGAEELALFLRWHDIPVWICLCVQKRIEQGQKKGEQPVGTTQKAARAKGTPFAPFSRYFKKSNL